MKLFWWVKVTAIRVRWWRLARCHAGDRGGVGDVAEIIAAGIGDDGEVIRPERNRQDLRAGHFEYVAGLYSRQQHGIGSARVLEASVPPTYRRIDEGDGVADNSRKPPSMP